MQAKKSAVRLAVLGLALGALSGCGGIGQGNTLAFLTIDKAQGVLGTSSKSFLCFLDRLQLVGTFNDGSRGDYSSRARWTSSNPMRVKVSSGDVQIDPDDITQGFFAHGTLIPQSVTADGETVTISAEYIGLRASFEVTVDTPDSLRVVTGSQLTADAPATQNVAVGSLEPIVALATFDGFQINVTGGATWAFDTPDVEDIATITRDSAIVAGVGASPDVLTARGTFTACPEAPAVGTDPVPAFRNATAPIRVAAPTGLTLAHEFENPATTNVGELIVGTTERLRAHAQFETGPDQDLTAQATLLIDEDDLASIFAPSLGLRTAITALTPPEGTTPGPVEVRANFGDDLETEDTVEGVTSTALSITPVVRTLESIAIAPQNPSITALTNRQFQAIGSYAGGTVTQDITRHVAWSTSDAAVAVLSNSAGSAGLATSVGIVNASAEVTATPPSGGAATAQTTTLCVYTPDTPEDMRPCPPPTP